MQADGSATGYLKSFDRKNGYGFVSCDELFDQHKRDVFIHQQFVGKAQVGDKIEFLYRINEQGHPQVVSVTTDDVEHASDGTGTRRHQVWDEEASCSRTHEARASDPA